MPPETATFAPTEQAAPPQPVTASGLPKREPRIVGNYGGQVDAAPAAQEGVATNRLNTTLDLEGQTTKFIDSIRANSATGRTNEHGYQRAAMETILSSGHFAIGPVESPVTHSSTNKPEGSHWQSNQALHNLINRDRAPGSPNTAAIVSGLSESAPPVSTKQPISPLEPRMIHRSETPLTSRYEKLKVPPASLVRAIGPPPPPRATIQEGPVNRQDITRHRRGQHRMSLMASWRERFRRSGK